MAGNTLQVPSKMLIKGLICNSVHIYSDICVSAALAVIFVQFGLRPEELQLHTIKIFNEKTGIKVSVSMCKLASFLKNFTTLVMRTLLALIRRTRFSGGVKTNRENGQFVTIDTREKRSNSGWKCVSYFMPVFTGKNDTQINNQMTIKIYFILFIQLVNVSVWICQCMVRLSTQQYSATLEL